MGFSDKKQTMVLDADMDRAFQALAKASAGLEGMKVAASDPAAHQMRLEMPMSAMSWGTDVLVSMAAVADNKTQVTVEVKSKMPTELFVGGKHQKTAEAVLAAIKAALA